MVVKTSNLTRNKTQAPIKHNTDLADGISVCRNENTACVWTITVCALKRSCVTTQNNCVKISNVAFSTALNTIKLPLRKYGRNLL
jgi:hypothetical protein